VVVYEKKSVDSHEGSLLVRNRPGLGNLMYHLSCKHVRHPGKLSCCPVQWVCISPKLYELVSCFRHSYKRK